jgi:hypothetical protein
MSEHREDLAEPASKSPADNQPETDDNCFEERDLESWYRYGDSNPGPVAENHVS